MSPIDQAGLPYVQKYFKKSHICEKNILCIPLCDGVHFQGYAVDISKKEIIHIDTLRPAMEKNSISNIISKVLFKQEDVRFILYFTTRVQFE